MRVVLVVVVVSVAVVSIVGLGVVVYEKYRAGEDLRPVVLAEIGSALAEGELAVVGKKTAVAAEVESALAEGEFVAVVRKRVAVFAEIVDGAASSLAEAAVVVAFAAVATVEGDYLSV